MFREELEKQQKEFRLRQDKFKVDQHKWVKEQLAKNAIQDELDAKRREEKLQKIKDLKDWRVEQAKIRERFYKSQREDQLKKEIELNQETMRKIKIEEMQQETKRRSHMRKMKDQMNDAQAQKADVVAVEAGRVVDDKK